MGAEFSTLEVEGGLPQSGPACCQPPLFLPPCPQPINGFLWAPPAVGELWPTQNRPPSVSAFSLGTMGQLVARGTVEGQG